MHPADAERKLAEAQLGTLWVLRPPLCRLDVLIQAARHPMLHVSRNAWEHDALLRQDLLDAVPHPDQDN